MSTPDAVDLLASRAASQLAVLVIDVQSGLFNTTPPPFEAAEVIHRINFVTGRARSAGVPVFIIQHDGPPEGDWLVPFSDGWQLHPDLNQATDDHFIRKTTADSFYGTNLERRLRSLGVQSLVLTGYATEFCVDATLRNAVSKEFEIFVVADAHTTNDSALLKAAVIRPYFNSVWPESSSARGIHLLNAADVRFAVATQSAAVG
ncbi:MAG TPA: cysteine hydrolase family protein [Verrucomicrobiae bacterium]|nr:cysteine hydrolase family protein [Verrucomicrobiae bacterium]